MAVKYYLQHLAENLKVSDDRVVYVLFLLL